MLDARKDQQYIVIYLVSIMHVYGNPSDEAEEGKGLKT
jgi:hypothetical protein